MTNVNAAVREEVSALKEEYLALLDKKEREQVYQAYIERNTRLIPRDFEQNHGISCGIVLRKLSFGADYKSDFFYLSKSTVLWHAVHIEIEKPSSKYFKEGSNTFHPDFEHAMNQVVDWRAWLIRDNEAAFRSQMSALLIPTHMGRNPIEHKFVVVYGRRSEYDGNPTRRSKIAALQKDDLRIISFDSLSEGLAGKWPVNIGIRRNEHIDILGNELESPEACGWMEPSQFSISNTAQANLLNIHSTPNPKSFRFVDGERTDSYEYFAKNARIRPDKDVAVVEGE